MSLKTPMFNWWPEAESNCRPLVFQTSALPTELSGLMAGTTGFEPATSCVTGRRELQTSPRPQLFNKEYYINCIKKIICGSGGNRTHDLELKRLLLYRLSYRPKKVYLKILHENKSNFDEIFEITLLSSQ